MTSHLLTAGLHNKTPLIASSAPTGRTQAFSLSEVLIALVLLGLILALTLPKILYSAQNAHFNSTAKDAMGAFSEVYTKMRMNGQLVSGVTLNSDIFEQLNATRDTTSMVDLSPLSPNGVSASCSVYVCYRFPSGAIIFSGADYIYVDGPSNALYFSIDPDGKVTSTSISGPGRSLLVLVYPSGKITTFGTMQPNTTVTHSLGGSVANPDPLRDPEWLQF